MDVDAAACVPGACDRPLVFPLDDTWGLVRIADEGICSMRRRPSYLGMCNYLATVHVSNCGVALIDYWWRDKGRYSSVDVFAENCTGQRCGMFTLNINFMGHLQGLKETPEAWTAGDGNGLEGQSPEGGVKQWAQVERQYFTDDNADGRPGFRSGRSVQVFV